MMIQLPPFGKIVWAYWQTGTREWEGLARRNVKSDFAIWESDSYVGGKLIGWIETATPVSWREATPEELATAA